MSPRTKTRGSWEVPEPHKKNSGINRVLGPTQVALLQYVDENWQYTWEIEERSKLGYPTVRHGLHKLARKGYIKKRTGPGVNRLGEFSPCTNQWRVVNGGKS